MCQKRNKNLKSWERRKSWHKKANFWCWLGNEEKRSTMEAKEMFIKRNVEAGYFHIFISILATIHNFLLPITDDDSCPFSYSFFLNKCTLYVSPKMFNVIGAREQRTPHELAQRWAIHWNHSSIQPIHCNGPWPLKTIEHQWSDDPKTIDVKNIQCWWFPW